ncbi:hypothetical protein AXF42_Ash018943 [Apostasia shenzhenica]|uniref:Nuclear condensin complex subunit 3 C-terminal domain-containing protein n=1 Tax=Apostasia shenzhenica TaxID=1088818 RepID=A0A2I0B4K5_9ASPA|nr:hypothetical protein AXF42_Ash018943 [Apostasia shenzhenica]
MMPESVAEDDRLSCKIAGILDECRLSHAVHNRKLKELAVVRSSAPPFCFFPPFARALLPLFSFPRRTVSAERTVRFIAAFVAHRDGGSAAACDAFLEEFLRFLLTATNASHRAARFRSCHIISEIIMRLPDDAEVSDEVWDEVIESMKQRLEDKVPAIRGLAVRALSRFASDVEDCSIVSLFLKNLPLEQNADVRKIIVLSLPPSSVTSSVIVGSTLDISESVRRAAYCVLANKFPLQSLSIKLRTAILQRGLSDRSSPVKRECLKMLKDTWLTKCCKGDPITLLRFLDVETYEAVGEAAMDALLQDGVVLVKEGQSIRQYLPKSEQSEGNCASGVQLMEAEVSLYWRTICNQLQKEAQGKGSDAANTTGTEAAFYASEASEKNDLLEAILPETISEYVDLVRAHLSAGPSHRFVARQLLLLGTMLDFSDSTNRKVASSFVQELLLRPPDYEVDDDGNKIAVGDCISLGGDRDWARAVSELARRINASPGEFEAAVASVLRELAQPCRERIADYVQWMHCLVVIGLLLENIESLRCLQDRAIEPAEILHSLLMPAAKQSHLDVQKAATRCLCLFGKLERRPNEDIIKQLRLLFIDGPKPVSVMAAKALLDLAAWHGPEEVDRAIGVDIQPSSIASTEFKPLDFSDTESIANIGVINLLYAAMEREIICEPDQSDDEENLHAVLGEGFAKFLLLGQRYPSIQACLHPLILSRLIILYFSDETKDMHRFRQCLSVFFEHYPALSPNHKASQNILTRCVSEAFVPVMRAMWPGVCGNPGGSSVMVSKMRKLAVQASRFMLQMMQMPMFSKELVEENTTEKNQGNNLSGSAEPKRDIDCVEEGLAIRIAAEVINCPDKKSSAGKSYISALCRVAILVQFRSVQQEAIKCMRALLSGMMASVSHDKELVRELNRMESRLKSIDMPTEQEVQDIFDKLGLDENLKNTAQMMLPVTPAPCSARAAPSRRRVRRKASDEQESDCESSAIPEVPMTVSRRSERASKTAAISKMISLSNIEFSDEEDEGGSDRASHCDSDDASDEAVT